MQINLPNIDPIIVSREIQNFIIQQILSAGKSGGVIGLSGGIDSTTVAYLAKQAFDSYNQKHNKIKLNLFGLIMPSKSNSIEDAKDGIRIAKNLGIDYREIAIESLVSSFTKLIPDIIRDDYDKGNLRSESRAIILSRVAAAKNSLILGTGNRDEDYCLGYFTKRGDGQVDISPIGDISKRHVKELASYLGVPKELVERTPTAGLWPGQTDEKELGFSYLEAETVIEGRDQGLSRQDIQNITNFGYVRKRRRKKFLL
ncbi:MAG: NAD(+) synthase [Patescibacteria group bacterium]